jgi:hypothetical protein
MTLALRLAPKCSLRPCLRTAENGHGDALPPSPLARAKCIVKQSWPYAAGVNAAFSSPLAVSKETVIIETPLWQTGCTGPTADVRCECFEDLNPSLGESGPTFRKAHHEPNPRGMLRQAIYQQSLADDMGERISAGLTCSTTDVDLVEQ